MMSSPTSRLITVPRHHQSKGKFHQFEPAVKCSRKKKMKGEGEGKDAAEGEGEGKEVAEGEGEGEEAAECLVKWDFHLVQEVSWLISAL